MIKAVLQSIEGVEVYSIITLLIFMIMFGAIVIYVMRMKKDDIQHYSLIPLDDPDPGNNDRPRSVGVRQWKED